jgi:2,3-bisphosphoglycerate-dependent phosphoglycerate mutase
VVEEPFFMGIKIVFETHSITEDNERGIATGWHPGRLSSEGRRFAKELGNRRRNDGIQAIFTSDLRRAVETVEIALGDTAIPIFHDWRLRECDYGNNNGMPTVELHSSRRQYLDEPYPNGESWRQAIHRVGRFLEDLHLRWESKHVLVVGHVATRWAFEHYLNHMALEELIEADFHWQEGWEYFLP